MNDDLPEHGDWAIPPGEKSPLVKKTRVEIPAHTDAWMRGDRYGEVERTFVQDRTSKAGHEYKREMARVRLDKSRKIVVVKLSDCKVLE